MRSFLVQAPVLAAVLAAMLIGGSGQIAATGDQATGDQGTGDLATGDQRDPADASRLQAIAAVDRRDASDPIFSQMSPVQRARYLGMIAGDEACARLQQDLSAGGKAKDLIAGLSLCRDKSNQAAIAAAAAALDVAELADIAPLIGIEGGEPMRTLFLERLKATQDPDVRRMLIDGLMQSFAYDRIDLATLSGTDPNADPNADPNSGPNATAGITAADLYAIGVSHQDAKGADISALYTLTRGQGLDASVSVNAILTAIAMTDQIQNLRHRQMRMYLLTLLLGQMGGAASPAATAALIEIADELRDGSNIAAIRALAGNRGPKAVDTLVDLALDAEVSVDLRVAALISLGGKTDLDADDISVLGALTGDASLWLAGAALDFLSRHDLEAAEKLAIDWLDEDTYLAMKARAILLRNEGGQSALKVWMAKNEGDTRAVKIEGALFPDTAAGSVARATPSIEQALAASEAVVALETERGLVLIKMAEDAPFAANNFVDLVNQNLMNDSVFHRVIPAFVAQWGESDRRGTVGRPSVRDNWLGGEHRYGSVGVATAGKDTGAAQFFINLMDNLHLTGRYTVVGHVILGMDVAEKIHEGDRVIRAYVARPPKLFWQE